MDLKAFIRDVPDFPQKGVVFRDITPLLQNPQAFDYLLQQMAAPFRRSRIDLVAGIESRGFVLAGAMSAMMGKGFVPVRKKGKLPWEKLAERYEKEYGPDILEMHADAVSPGQQVLVVDDVLATGGTAQATARLIERVGGRPSFCFAIELGFLNGMGKLKGYDVFSLMKY